MDPNVTVAALDPSDMAQLTLMVTLVTQLLKQAVPKKYGLMTAFVVSIAILALWAWSHGDYTRENSWDYAIALMLVTSTAAVAFEVMQAGALTAGQVTGGIRNLGASMVQSFKGQDTTALKLKKTTIKKKKEH